LTNHEFQKLFELQYYRLIFCSLSSAPWRIYAAAILSTNNVNGGIEIVAATDYEEAIRFSKLDKQNQAKTPLSQSSPKGLDINQTIQQINFNREAKNKAATTAVASHHTEKAPSTFHSTPTSRDSNIQQSTQNVDFKNDKVGARTYQSEHLPTQQRLDWGTDPVISNVHDELKLLRGLLQGQLAENDWSRRKNQNPVEAEILKRLVNLGLPVELAESYAKVEENTDLGDAWYRVAASFGHDIPVAEENIIESGGCFALVGPTGVGKTTSIAKLAALAVKKYGADEVALISTDSYRIAAHQQLEIYAQIMGVVVALASDAHELDQALANFSDKKLVFIDTAGIGQRDRRLTEQLACLNVSEHKINHLLVLSATSQLANLHESVKRFGQFRLQGAIITKLDEATSLGTVLATIIRSQLDLYYITDGQNVPDDIHQAKAHQLVTEAISLANQYPQEISEEWRLAQNLKRVS